MSKKKVILSRGFEDVQKKVEKNSRYTRSCDNCEYYNDYIIDEQEEDTCTHPSVLPYDICIDGDRVYCSFWRYASRRSV